MLVEEKEGQYSPLSDTKSRRYASILPVHAGTPLSMTLAGILGKFFQMIKTHEKVISSDRYTSNPKYTGLTAHCHGYAYSQTDYLKN